MSAFNKQVLNANGKLTGRRITESGAVVNTADVARQIGAAIDPFAQMHVAEYSPIIELKSSYGTSILRDAITTTNGGSVSWSDGEFIVSGEAAEDTVFFATAERGRYLAGLVGLAGLGVRAIREPTAAGDSLRWGYFDSDQGFGFGLDPNGLFTFTRRGGEDIQKRYRADWLNDKLDGNGPSGLKMEPPDGAVYRIPYIWYGYGTIAFDILVRSEMGSGDTLVNVDRQDFPGSISIPDPNLPISVELSGDCSLAVGGRQYGIFGRYDPNRRIVSDFRGAVSINADGWTPLVSFRIKDPAPSGSAGYRSAAVKVAGAGVLSTENAVWALFYDATLTGASFATPDGHTAAETVTDYDKSATAMSGGECIYKGTVAGGQGNRSGAMDADLPDLDIPTGGVVTLAARTFTGTGSASGVLRDKQEW